jgi:hypothetical protein
VKLRSKLAANVPANCRLMWPRRKCVDQASPGAARASAPSPGDLPLERMSRLNSANRPLGSPWGVVAQGCRSMPHTPAGPRRVRGVGEYPAAAAGGEVLALHTVGVFAAATAISRGRFCPPGSRESHDCAGLSATGSMLRTNCRAERIWRGRVHKRRARGNRMHYEW